MNAELGSSSVEARDTDILTGLAAMHMKAIGKISPDTRYFVTDEGNEVLVKEVQGGLNVMMPKTELPIHFVKEGEITRERASGILSILDECTEIRLGE